MNFKVIESNTSFEGYILDIRKDKIEFENGLQADRELVVKHHEAAAVLAIASLLVYGCQFVFVSLSIEG